MQNKLFIALLGFLALVIISCSPKQSELVVAEYGDYKISMDEFEKAYAKNVGGFEKAKKDSIENYKNFLDLYVNFKMKLRNAEVRGLPENNSIVSELDNYEKSIGKSYLLEKELYEKGMKQLYDRRSFELRVSHILIRTDTLDDKQAKQKANDIIKRIQNGSTFEEEVKQNSEDQFSKNKGGDIYYITAGMIMPEFEDAAYNTAVGKINPTPLKTKYGYHIIKVTEKRKRIPQIGASHILIKSDSKNDQEKKKFAEEILVKAQKGEDFGALAAKYSDDPGSKQKNGALGYFSRRQMVQPFDEAAFNLKVGEISDLVKTQFGYHIIKVTDRLPYPSYAEEKKKLRDLYERTRKKMDYEKLVMRYSKDVNLVMHDEVLKNIVPNLGDITFGKDYFESELHNNYGQSVLFTIDDNKFTTDSLITYALKDSKMLGKAINEKDFLELKNKYKDDKVIEAKAKTLINNDPKFASLMEEYKNGILIFKLQEDEVWNKMKMDSIKINKLYEETKDSYVWPDRVEYSELFTKSDSLAHNYYTMLKNGVPFDTLMAKYNEKKSAGYKSNFGLVNATSNKLSEVAYKLKYAGDFSDVIKNANGWSIVKVLKKDPSHTKSFDEARAEVTSAYQDIESAQLENGYVSKLQKLYEPKLFYEELAHAYQK